MGHQYWKPAEMQSRGKGEAGQFPCTYGKTDFILDLLPQPAPAGRANSSLHTSNLCAQLRQHLSTCIFGHMPGGGVGGVL